MPDAITRAVIGRPINFEGLGGDETNQQAPGIIGVQRTGLASVTWYSSMAGCEGWMVEATLTEEQRGTGSGHRRRYDGLLITADGSKWHITVAIVKTVCWGTAAAGGDNDLDIAPAFKPDAAARPWAVIPKGIALPILRDDWNAIAINVPCPE